MREQTIDTPPEDWPVAPSFEQKAPGVTVLVAVVAGAEVKVGAAVVAGADVAVVVGDAVVVVGATVVVGAAVVGAAVELGSEDAVGGTDVDVVVAFDVVAVLWVVPRSAWVLSTESWALVPSEAVGRSALVVDSSAGMSAAKKSSPTKPAAGISTRFFWYHGRRSSWPVWRSGPGYTAVGVVFSVLKGARGGRCTGGGGGSAAATCGFGRWVFGHQRPSGP